jgi:hypothetical protein
VPDNRSERPFVEPTITPEASLTDVTLLSGGYSGKKGKGHGHENRGGGHGNGGHGGEHHGSGGRGH